MRIGTFADPDNWAIGSWEFDWVNANVIRDRAQNIAHAANKPFIIEETGMKVPPLHSTLSEVPPRAILMPRWLCIPILKGQCIAISSKEHSLQYIPSQPWS